MRSKASMPFKFLLSCSLFLCLGAAWIQEPIRIYSIGDSTMASYSDQYLNNFGPDYPIRGWMQMASGFFSKRVELHNYPRSGRSSKSFRAEGDWEKVIASVKPGDYVFIQFGHNDAKQEDPARFSDPAAFRNNLLDYVREVREQGAQPVLFTSIPRRRFDRQGNIPDSHGEYVQITKQVAAETNTPLVDLHQLASDWLKKLGPEASVRYFLHIPPGKYDKLPSGKKDDTHLSADGATKIASLAAEGLRKLQLPISKEIL